LAKSFGFEKASLAIMGLHPFKAKLVIAVCWNLNILCMMLKPSTEERECRNRSHWRRAESSSGR